LRWTAPSRRAGPPRIRGDVDARRGPCRRRFRGDRRALRVPDFRVASAGDLFRGTCTRPRRGRAAAASRAALDAAATRRALRRRVARRLRRGRPPRSARAPNDPARLDRPGRRRPHRSRCVNSPVALSSSARGDRGRIGVANTGSLGVMVTIALARIVTAMVVWLVRDRDHRIICSARCSAARWPRPPSMSPLDSSLATAALVLAFAASPTGESRPRNRLIWAQPPRPCGWPEFISRLDETVGFSGRPRAPAAPS
jgi:hypothetical protein